MYIDSHCHLDFPILQSEIHQLISLCKSKGINRFVIPAIGPENWSRIVELCKLYPQCFPAFGFHPCFLKDIKLTQVDDLALFIAKHPAVAIGEIGLDASIDTPMELQLSFFIAQLDLADSLNVPVLIHSRKTHDRIHSLLKRYKGRLTGIIHGFSGSLQQAEAFIALGFKLGVGGVITYPRSKKTQHAIANVPLTALVLETDSPDMPLFGQQGKVNTPAFIPDVVESLSLLRQESKETLIKQLRLNTIQVIPAINS